jgi:hypothetical protein
LEVLWRELDGFALAVWFMDDGASDGGQVRLNSQGFSYDENLALATFLQAKFGITVSINKDKGRWRLRVAAAGISVFRELVAPHVIPSMLYKLPL